MFEWLLLLANVRQGPQTPALTLVVARRCRALQVYGPPSSARIGPWQGEGSVVFTYLDALDQGRAELEAPKDRYPRGGIGGMAVNRRLEDVLQATLAPIRVLQQGSQKAQPETQKTQDELREHA